MRLRHGKLQGGYEPARHMQVQAGSLAVAASSAARMRWTAQLRSSSERHQAVAGELSSTPCKHMGRCLFV